MTTTMKGLLKGLRYISQVFDEDKEHEMQIGNPTDVKHVAHIGLDGPSVQSPSWMNEYRATPEYSSAPSSMGNGLANDGPKRDSEGSSRTSTRSIDSPSRDLPEVPRSSRRHSSTSDSPLKEKSERSKHSKSSTRKESSRHLIQDPSTNGNDSPSQNLPNIPKKSRRKKSKDISAEGSTRSSSSSSSRSKGHHVSSSAGLSSAYESPFSDPGTGAPGSGYLNNGHHQNPSLQVFDERREEKLGGYGIA